VLSALFSAGRHDELIKLIGGDPHPMWRDLLWVGRVKVARGEIDAAIEFLAKSVNHWTPMAGLVRFAEGVLLHAGRPTEAYEKYALEANRATTYLSTFRLIAGKYPEIDPDRVLSDLMATTPGQEGKWFATAKTLKRFELALRSEDADPGRQRQHREVPIVCCRGGAADSDDAPADDPPD
jgi:hypothetical protein